VFPADNSSIAFYKIKSFYMGIYIYIYVYIYTYAYIYIYIYACVKNYCKRKITFSLLTLCSSGKLSGTFDKPWTGGLR